MRTWHLAIALMMTLGVQVFADSDLGRIDFPNSGAADAQDSFIRGVLLLHSFEYEDARDAFRKASQIDPDFALAYWGEAMTHNHPLWRQLELDAARGALARFAPTPEERLEKTKTERERDYMRAADILFGEGGDKVQRDKAFSDAMGELAARYPEDLEARAFYALSILGTAEGVRDFRIYMRAGAVAEEVFAVNPLHPGAAHYMIHSFDDPIHAPLGLRAARVYAGIAPAASHAQHMISHIYVALGQWADSVQANVNAVDVSVERRRQKSLGPDAVSYHALHWLEYSYLELGRVADARKTLEMMTKLATESGSGSAMRHHAMMRATWIVETGGMEGPAELETDKASSTSAVASIFGTGYHALRTGDLAGAREASRRISNLETDTVAARQSKSDTGMGISNDDLAAIAVMKSTLQAAIALETGNGERASKQMLEATAIEDSMALEYGPPTIVKPSHEAFGEMLLRLERPADAMVEFRKALERAPRRTLSLRGMAHAASAAHHEKALEHACASLADILAGADETISAPDVCPARK